MANVENMILSEKLYLNIVAKLSSAGHPGAANVLKVTLLISLIGTLLLIGDLRAQIDRLLPQSYPGFAWIDRARLFSHDLGYIFTKNAEIYRYAEGDWAQRKPPAGITPSTVFFTGPEDFWAAYQSPNTYRQLLLHYRNGTRRQVDTPNTKVIREMIFLTPDAGWAGCDWGEMLVYKGGRWRQIPVPTRRRIIRFDRDRDGNLYALSDNQGHSENLQYNGWAWEQMNTPPLSEFKDFLVLNPESLWTHPDGKQDGLWFITKQKATPAPADSFCRFEPEPDGNGHVVPDRYRPHLARNGMQKLLQLAAMHSSWSLSFGADSSLWRYNYRLWASSMNSPPQRALPISQFLIKARFDLGKVESIAYMRPPASASWLYIADVQLENRKVNIHPYSQMPEDKMPSASKFGLLPPRKRKGEAIRQRQSAAAAEFNNDGREDLFLTHDAGFDYFLNLGNKIFKESAAWAHITQRGFQSGIATAADIDHDGDLDIFVPELSGQNSQFLNNGGGKFAEVSQSRGLSGLGGATAANFADLDGDGWSDLVVLARATGTRLFCNAGNGFFVEILDNRQVLQPSGPEKASSLRLADIDNDGDLDLFICKKLAGNALLQNLRGWRFRDVTAGSGLRDSILTESSAFFDFDNDGDLDLDLVNRGKDQLFKNTGDLHFADASPRIMTVSAFCVGGEQASDYRGQFSTSAIVLDGEMDLLVSSFDSYSFIYKNEFNNQQSTSFHLHGAKSNHSATGARVRLFSRATPNAPQKLLGLRRIEGGSGNGSDSEKLIHFPTSPGPIHSAEVIFAGGDTLRLNQLEPGHRDEVEEREGGAGRIQELNWQLRNLLPGYRSWHRLVLLILLCAGLFLAFNHFQSRGWWHAPVPALAVAAAFAGLLLPALTLVWHSTALYLIVPLCASALFATVAVWPGRAWMQRHYSEADLSTLSLKLAAFAHSETHANLLGSLNLQLDRLLGELRTDAASADRLRYTIAQTNKIIFPEIAMISEYLHALKVQPKSARLLLLTCRRIQRQLRRLGQSLAAHEQVKNSFVAEVIAGLSQSQTMLRALRNSMYKSASRKAGETTKCGRRSNRESGNRGQTPQRRQRIGHLSAGVFCGFHGSIAR